VKVLRLGSPSTDGREKHALVFTFDDAWTVVAFDEGRADAPFANPDAARLGNWRFRALWKEGVPRRPAAAPRATGHRAVDIVAWSPDDRTLYLIESTDYRAADPGPLPETLPDEAAAKFRDTLASLALGKVPRRRSWATLTDHLCEAAQVVCVLHLEFPEHPLLGSEDALNLFERWRAVMRPTELPCLSREDPAGWTVTSETFSGTG
jgi:hypothetical protein